MNNFLFLASDYIKGKAIYPSIRRFLNLLFLVSITSFFYERLYGRYTLDEITNYKVILDFFVKGHFFIPFSIFVIVYALTQFISFLVFKIFYLKKSLKITKEIFEQKIEKEDLVEGAGVIESYLNNLTHINLSKEEIIEVYTEIKQELSYEDIMELKKVLNDQKDIIELNFVLILRMFIAVTIYYASLENFGGYLYYPVIAILILLIIVLYNTYKYLDIAPALFEKFSIHLEYYLNKIDETSDTDTRQ